MEQRLKSYLAYLAGIVNETPGKTQADEETCELLRREILVQIRFFQHERLIHLIVTVAFGILTMLSLLGIFIAGDSKIPMVVLLAFFLILLIPYIRHYYILENGVQKLYEYYDEITANKCWRA